MTAAEDRPKKRELVSIEMKPDLKAMIQQVMEAEPEIDVSKLFRRALRFWVDEAPQATAAEELWLLVAMRKLKKQNPALWASALKTINTLAKPFGAAMTQEMYESLEELAETHQPPSKRRKSAG